MALPPWREPLDAALLASAAAPSARYLCLATVRPDGRPAVRTIVFRGFDAKSRLLCSTDARSAKAANLRGRPFAEVCWFFEPTREQFRLSGTVTVADAHTADRDLAATRRAVWQGHTPLSRSMFFWPAPGTPVVPPDATAGVQSPEPPATFAILVLDAEAADHLDLRPTPHRRTLFRRGPERSWRAEDVNP